MDCCYVFGAPTWICGRVCLDVNITSSELCC